MHVYNCIALGIFCTALIYTVLNNALQLVLPVSQLGLLDFFKASSRLQCNICNQEMLQILHSEVEIALILARW